MCFVLENNIDHFRHLPHLIGSTVGIIHWYSFQMLSQCFLTKLWLTITPESIMAHTRKDSDVSVVFRAIGK